MDAAAEKPEKRGHAVVRTAKAANPLAGSGAPGERFRQEQRATAHQQPLT